MDDLEELEKRILRLVKVNHLEVDAPEAQKIGDWDDFEFGFGWALHFVLEVIAEFKNKSV